MILFYKQENNYYYKILFLTSFRAFEAQSFYSEICKVEYIYILVFILNPESFEHLFIFEHELASKECKT